MARQKRILLLLRNKKSEHEADISLSNTYNRPSADGVGAATRPARGTQRGVPQ